MKYAMLIQLIFWMFSLFNGILEESVEEINSRYSGDDLSILVEKVNSLSDTGAIRDRFYKFILKESKIVDPVIAIEYTSSGEVFSYSCRVIGFNKNKDLFKLDYSFYSNQEKVKMKRLKDFALFNQEMSAIKSTEYDDGVKVAFPSDLILVSYVDSGSRWKFRLSETPTIHVMKILYL